MKRRARVPSAALAAAWLTLGAAGACVDGSSARPPLRVAAASDLGPAFEALAKDFTAGTGHAVVFTFGATATLASQIAHGAPFDVFAAADDSYIEQVVRAGACDGATRGRIGEGSLVLIGKPGGGAAPRSLQELVDPRFRRVAIASPLHAPYGRAAREALIAAGVWGAIEARVVYAENVRQALQFVDSGNVDAAIVARSFVEDRGSEAWAAVPRPLHAPLRQELVVCAEGQGRAAADAFSAWVSGPEGQRVLGAHGLSEPAVERDAGVR